MICSRNSSISLKFWVFVMSLLTVVMNRKDGGLQREAVNHLNAQCLFLTRPPQDAFLDKETKF